MSAGHSWNKAAAQKPSQTPNRAEAEVTCDPVPVSTASGWRSHPSRSNTTARLFTARGEGRAGACWARGQSGRPAEWGGGGGGVAVSGHCYCWPHPAVDSTSADKSISAIGSDWRAQQAVTVVLIWRAHLPPPAPTRPLPAWSTGSNSNKLRLKPLINRNA